MLRKKLNKVVKSEVSEKACETCNTMDCFIKKHCSEEYKSKLNNITKTSIYRKNQHIASEGNSVLGLFFIKSGKAKIISSGLEGRPQVVRLTKTGDIIGHRGYGGDKYPISAIALEDSNICFIDNDTIFDTFMDNPTLTFELMMYYSRELRKSEAKIKNQAQMNVREKVADALLYCNSFFKNTGSKSNAIQLNRQDLADIAGINTEQLSRILSGFKMDNKLSLSKNEIIINDLNYLSELTSPFGVNE